MKSDWLLALVLMGFALAVFLYPGDWPMEAGLYPRAVSVLIFILSSVLLVKPQDERKKTPGSMLQEAIENKNVLFIVLLTIAFVASIETLGFFIALPVYLMAAQLLMGLRRPKSILLATAIITVVIYLIFVTLLGIRIPIAFFMM